MTVGKQSRKIQWLPILLIIWNIFDIAVHVAVDMVEPLRVTGNVVGIAAALIVLLGFAKAAAPHLLAIAAVVVVALNALFASEEGFEIPMLIFIGIALFLLLRWAQVKATHPLLLVQGAQQPTSPSLGEELSLRQQEVRWYHRWWMAFFAALIGVAIVLLSGLSANADGSSESALTSNEQLDTTPDSSLPREANSRSAELLSAFFGLDDNLPRTANVGICDGAGGADGMPVIFSTEIDPDTMQAGDFQVTTASGKIGSLACATLNPAINEGELRTVLLTGDYGSADADPPVTVKIVGNLHSLDQTLNFKGAEISVTPLEPGPSLVFAEVVPQENWHLGRESDGSWGSSDGCPTNGVAQIVRVAWAGGVTLENGNEPEADDSVGQLYKVTVESTDGSTREVTPVALGDLHDGDNNHELCLDTDDPAVSVSFPAGILTDPNNDLNPATKIRINP